MSTNVFPPGAPVKFSNFAIGVNLIVRLERGAAGIGVRVHTTQNWYEDTNTTLKEAVALWEEALRFK